MDRKRIEREVRSITKQIVNKYRPNKIILFGSLVWGEFTEDSDLDFLIIKKGVPFYGRDRIRELDDLIKYSLPVDILVYRPDEFEERIKMNDPFIMLIVNKGRVLYG